MFAVCLLNVFVEAFLSLRYAPCFSINVEKIDRIITIFGSRTSTCNLETGRTAFSKVAILVQFSDFNSPVAGHWKKKNRHEYIISELGITNPGLKFVGFIDVSCSKTDLFSRYWEQKKSGVAPPKKEFAKQDCRKEWDTVYKNHNWDTELDHHQYQNESFLGKRHHDPSWIQDISPGKYSPTFYKVFFCR